MVVRVGTMTAKEGFGAELLAFAQSIILPALQRSEGFLGGELLHSKDAADTIMIIERWTDEAAHAASVKQIRPEDLQIAMGMLGGAPAGAYYNTIQTATGTSHE